MNDCQQWNYLVANAGVERNSVPATFSESDAEMSLNSHFDDQPKHQKRLPESFAQKKNPAVTARDDSQQFVLEQDLARERCVDESRRCRGGFCGM